MIFSEKINIISIVKSIFKVLCLAISFFLILQLIYVFVEEKPTSTTNLEEELELTDLPEVVVCMDPGFNNSALKKYGYNIRYYWKGIRIRKKEQEKFVGWNGDKDYNKSSHEILEEALLFPKIQDILYGSFYGENDGPRDANVSFRMLIVPFGRCMVFSPPSQNGFGAWPHGSPPWVRRCA